jgi:hypothetical protein
MFGHRCHFCGLYIKPWQRWRHESWHADCMLETLRLLCPHCQSEHTKDHVPCEKYPDCRCICNAFGGE